MLFTNVVLLGSAALVAANPFKRADGDLTFPLDSIPSVCDQPCKIYKDIFSTCPGNSGAAVCGGVCNGTTLTELQVCINCTLVNGPPNGMTQFNIDVLNIAQQQLAQSCVDGGFPTHYDGKVPSPNTVAYPSGVDKATHILNSTVAPATATRTAAPSSTNGTMSVPASATTASVGSAPSGKLDGGAATLSLPMGLMAAAAGAALLL